MTVRSLVVVLSFIVVLAGGGSAIALARSGKSSSSSRPTASHATSSRTAASSHSAPAKVATAQPRGCPAVLKLPGNALAGATDAAIRSMTHTDSKLLDREDRGAIAMYALRATRTSMERKTITDACGRTFGPQVIRRTIVVGLFFPHQLPSVSASRVELFVALFKDGHYKVWDQPYG